MNLYLISRPDVEVRYDETAAMVISAHTPDAARKLAAETSDGREAAIWLQSNQSQIRCIGTATASLKPGIVLVDFRAG